MSKSRPDLIYCADGNKRFAEIAINSGFLYGARLPPRGLPFEPYFADQDWKQPNRERYMVELAKYKPAIATVLDWERYEQLETVLEWAEEATQYVTEAVLIIPKVIGGVSMIPEAIDGKPVRLAYSVPTRYGGTSVPVWEFGRRPVHLLGGSPKRQWELSHYLNVVSMDGNYSQMMATRFNEFWDGSGWCELADYGGHVSQDAPYEAFKRSCHSIMAMWHDEPMPYKRP